MKKEKIASVIIETKNYESFELLGFNRNINKTQALESSIKKYGYLDAYPIHVVKNGSGKLKIKDGHHRFYICKKSNLAVKYVVVNCDISVLELNKTTTTWSIDDYLDAHIRKGNPDCLAIKDYMEETGVTARIAASLLMNQQAGSGNATKKIKDGTYKIGNLKHSEDMKGLIFHLKANKINIAENSIFLSALSKALMVKEFSIQHFKNKISSFPELFEKRPTVDDYLDLVEAIYNRKSGKKQRLPIKHMANEASKIRKDTFGRKR